MIRYTLFAVMVVVFLSYVSGQTDLAHSYTPDKQPLNETALFVADALYKHPVLFRKLLKIGAAAKPLLKLGGNDPKLGMFWNFVLDMLPGLLQSPETASILEILADELHRVNITDVYGFLQAHNMTQDNPQAKQMVSGAIWKRFDKLRTVRRILTGNSARHFLPMTSNDTITDVCYNDMMNFMDAMISAQIPPRDALNYTFIPWALNMLDSYGKPPSGIFEGNVHWLGEPKECRSIHAQLAPGVILGNKTLTSPIDFKGKYCRAVFHHLPLVADISQMAEPVQSADSTDMKTITPLLYNKKGNQYSRLPLPTCYNCRYTDDTVTWGVCVPDTCSEQDVEEMFQLGFMKNFQTTPDNVSCSDIQEPTGHVPVTPRTPTTGPPTTTFSSRPSVAANSLFTSCSDCKDRIKPDEWMNCFFSSFDTDKNGNISKREWWSESHKLGLDTTDQGQIARAFIQLDINKDLQIDAPDLKYLFAFSDDNGDGFVNLQEFSYNWQSVVS